MKIIDISLTIDPRMPVWPGDPQPVVEQVMFMDQGEIANVSRIVLGVHTGTHVDAPHHFMNDHRTVETLSLEVLTGSCQVVELADQSSLVTADILEKAGIPAGVTRLLVKTGNSRLWQKQNAPFFEDFVAISEDGADWLVKRGIRLVGVDYLSVAPFRVPVPTHRVLLGAGVIIIEGLNLSEVKPGEYQLFCLPLKISHSDGAPARVILIQE